MEGSCWFMQVEHVLQGRTHVEGTCWFIQVEHVLQEGDTCWRNMLVCTGRACSTWGWHMLKGSCWFVQVEHVLQEGDTCWRDMLIHTGRACSTGGWHMLKRHVDSYRYSMFYRRVTHVEGTCWFMQVEHVLQDGDIYWRDMLTCTGRACSTGGWHMLKVDVGLYRWSMFYRRVTHVEGTCWYVQVEHVLLEGETCSRGMLAHTGRACSTGGWDMFKGHVDSCR